MELRVLILFLFLAAASVCDLKGKCIPVWIFILTGMVVVFFEFGYMAGEVSDNVDMEVSEQALVTAEQVMRTGKLILVEKLGGMAVGLVLLIISKLTQGQIGEGDGVTFLITGFSLGFERNSLLLLEALLLSFVWSLFLILMKKINLKTSLPFLPFVMTAFMIQVIPVMFFQKG